MQESYHYNCNDDKKPNSSEMSKLDLCIDSIIKKEGYISCDVIKKNIPSDGGNYLGDLIEININGKTANGDKETPIFIKVMAPNAMDNDLISLDNVYIKELFVYTELAKVFSELQDEAEVPKKERFRRAKSYEESNNKAIILENLTSKGFKTWYRMNCVSLDMAEACIKELAKFHGLSFVIKDKRPEYFDNKIKALDLPFKLGTNAQVDFSNNFTKITLEYLDEDTRRKVKDKINVVMQKYPEYLQDEESKCCVCHGDYRPNNIMFKEEEGKITEVIPVDYQLIHYGCPTLDFLYFIYTGTDVIFRRKHISFLKDLYYETLKNYLKYFDVSAELVYPRSRFEKEFEEKRDYGLMISVMYVPFTFVLEGEVPDVMSKDTVSNIEFPLDARFRDRFVGTVNEFIELGFL